jgi:putative exporter of polyketide antibiotics
MEQLTTFIADHWEPLLAAAVAVIGGGVAWRWRSHRQSGSSSFSDQRNARAGGDVVGRDKIVGRDDRK